MAIRLPTFKRRHLRLLEMIRANAGKLALAMFCMLIMAATQAATAFLVKPVLDDIFVKKDEHMLTILPLVVIGLYVMRGVAYYGQNVLMTRTGESIIKTLRDNLYDRMMDLDLSFFQGEKTGALMSRVTNDVTVIRGLVSRAVTSALRDFFTVLGLTFVIFYRDWKMAIFALVVLPAAFYPIYWFGRKVRKAATGVQEGMADVSSILQETFSGNIIVKAFNMEAYEKRRFFEHTDRVFNMEMRAIIAKSLSSPIMEILAGLGIAFVMWYGGYQVIRGESTPGTFFSFMAAVLMLYDPVKKISYLNNDLQEGLAAADRVFDVIEREPAIQEKPDAVDLGQGPHTIKFENVSFRYEENWVLRDANLTVRPGEVVAIVGTSGGGKSTLVNLVPRFFDVTEGRVTIDGHDVRDLTVSSLRNEIAIVTQSPILFNDTIRNNIAYGNRDADDAAIEQAAKDAYALDFIKRLPQGLESNVGELGARLSGGEKQRMCIARALLKDAPILILDEATSSLDTESERIVQKALDNLMQGRTAFVIAHRLSTVRKVDRILVVVNGEVVEEGNHEELMARGGEYSKLHAMQFETDRDDITETP
ncbi:MAG: lipid A export permease/ATP-binding protein MsbA [Desulfatibacillaceae bacterium]